MRQNTAEARGGIMLEGGRGPVRIVKRKGGEKSHHAHV